MSAVARHFRRPIPDAALRSAIRDEIEWDTRVDSGKEAIGVDVQSGIVTLTGRVSSCSQRSAAQDAAHRVMGVLDVVNEIHVLPPDDDLLSDLEIVRALRAAFLRDSRLPHEHIHTTVSDGVVTLEGRVPHLSQHDDAESIARTLRGVREVKNFVRVEPPVVPDGALKQAIADALSRHAEHVAKHVTFEIEGNVVTLAGEVSSVAERRAIVGAIRGMPGIAAVENDILVG